MERPNNTIYINNLNEKVKKDGKCSIQPINIHLMINVRYKVEIYKVDECLNPDHNSSVFFCRFEEILTIFYQISKYRKKKICISFSLSFLASLSSTLKLSN